MRKLQREKDKARNLDQRCRELKIENENLRLSLPLDESCLIKDNNYDIPNNINSSHRQETKQVRRQSSITALLRKCRFNNNTNLSSCDDHCMVVRFDRYLIFVSLHITQIQKLVIMLTVGLYIGYTACVFLCSTRFYTLEAGVLVLAVAVNENCLWE